MRTIKYKVSIYYYHIYYHYIVFFWFHILKGENMAPRKLQGCIQNLLYWNLVQMKMNRHNFLKKPYFNCICLNNKCLVTCRFHTSFILYIFAYIKRICININLFLKRGYTLSIFVIFSVSLEYFTFKIYAFHSIKHF